MIEYTLENEIIKKFNEIETFSFPKYTSQLINLANQNAQGTRPDIVGKMSELFPKFMDSGEEINIHNWHNWYIERCPDAIDNATDKIYTHMPNLRKAIDLIDPEMIKNWVKDLVINKTFKGMYIQIVILAYLAERKGSTYRLATPEEESIGIDGYVGNIAYSIKPKSYKRTRLSEKIDVKMIFYKENKTGLTIKVEE